MRIGILCFWALLAAYDVEAGVRSMGHHERGFGFLENTAVDQHLLGIGLDSDATIVAHGDEIRVIASGFVAVYDPRLVRANGAFYFLQKGQRLWLFTGLRRRLSREPSK